MPQRVQAVIAAPEVVQHDIILSIYVCSLHFLVHTIYALCA